jgi:hypothetical protein
LCVCPNDAWSNFTDEWAPRLAAALADTGLGTATEPEEHVTQFTLERDDTGREPWYFRSSSSDWRIMFKHGWWRRSGDEAERFEAAQTTAATFASNLPTD